MGHAAVIGSDCAVGIVRDFLRNLDEEPDRRCLENSTFEFFLPYDGRPVTFMPIIERPLRLKGIVPQGWRKETVDSVYYRRACLFDPTQVVFSAISLSKEQSFQALSNSFSSSGFDETPKKMSVRAANGLDWTIYTSRFNGEPVFLALAEVQRNRTLVLVMVVSANSPRKAPGTPRGVPGWSIEMNCLDCYGLLLPPPGPLPLPGLPGAWVGLGLFPFPGPGVASGGLPGP